MLELVVIFVLGLCFGSFVQALTWRLRKKKDWVKARSQCESCGHELLALDLIPLLSWLTLKGRCRYCKKPIHWSAPLMELILGAVFVISYAFWPVALQGGQWLLFVTWLAASVGLLALAVYDLRFMLLPNNILYPTFLVAITGRLAYILFFSNDIARSSWLLALSLLVASGIFWLIYELSRGKAIGFGDVRLGLISGTVLADPLLSLQMIFVASALGVVAILPELLSHRKTLTSKVPYGPFLISATFIVLLFGNSFTTYYQSLILH
ncbi:MAG: prepilin peptidase [Patescibacteria group bacterium]